MVCYGMGQDDGAFSVRRVVEYKVRESFKRISRIGTWLEYCLRDSINSFSQVAGSSLTFNDELRELIVQSYASIFHEKSQTLREKWVESVDLHGGFFPWDISNRTILTLLDAGASRTALHACWLISGLRRSAGPDRDRGFPQAGQKDSPGADPENRGWILEAAVPQDRASCEAEKAKAQPRAP